MDGLLMNERRIRYLGLKTSPPERWGPYFIEVVEDEYGPGILREISTDPTGAVIGKKPDARDDHPTIFNLPDLEEALRTGEMWEIERNDFEEAWNRPVQRKPGILGRIRDALRSRPDA